MTTMARKQTLAQALYLAQTGKSRDLRRAANALNGLPEGGWPDTRQARRDIADYLPNRERRDYTVGDFIAAAYTITDGGNGAGRYQSAL